ncbi:MAG TPA: anti-sigma factor domain-containing protein [Clostridium sp.]|jgi:hypothetical protein|nr:anti-sigma factor domain-containing protein [Clostridium sp.]
MRLKGLIMDVGQHTVTVLTKDNEFYTLKRKPTMFKTQEIEFKSSDIINLAYYMKRLSVAVACFVLILTGMVFSDIIPVWNVNNTDVFGFVSLDVNPSIEFEIDGKQKILGISYLEGLTDTIEEDLNLKGMEISEGLLEVIRYYNQINILSDNEENYVLLAGTINDKNKIVRKNIAEAEKKIMDSLKSYKNRVDQEFQRINMIVIESNNEYMELSKTNHISMGKYTIFAEINQVKDDISIEEFKELSLKDIIEEYMKLPKNHLDSEEKVESTPDVGNTPKDTPTPNSTIEPTEEVTSTPVETPTTTPVETLAETPAVMPAETSTIATPAIIVTPTTTPRTIEEPQSTPTMTPIVNRNETPVPNETQNPRVTPSGTPIIKPSNTPVSPETQSPRPTPSGTPIIWPSNTPVLPEIQNPRPTPSIKPTEKPGNNEPEDIGTGLRGEYYDNADFTNLVGIRIDSEINFNWENKLPHSDLNDDGSLSIRWEGQIKAQNTEMYTFHINRGYGVRLWINDMMVINEWTKDLWGMSSFGHIFLVGGQKYNIKLEYYEFNNFGNYGNIKLEWSSMSTPKEVVPQSALFPSDKPLTLPEELPGDGEGLKGQYYNDMDFKDFKLERIDPVVNFNWGINPPDTTMFNNGVFGVRWTGKIQPPYSEEYTFYVTRNSGARLWINNQLIINEWNDMWNVTNTGKIYLEAGKKYDIRLEYYKNMGIGAIRLEWSSMSMPKNVVPQSRLYSN